MEIRDLRDDEFKLVEPVFNEYDAPMPSPRLATIVGAFDGDRLAGFIVIQRLLHPEPLYVYPEYRKTDIWYRLTKRVRRLLNGSLAFAIPETRDGERVCELMGMSKSPYPTYVSTTLDPHEEDNDGVRSVSTIESQ